MLDMISQKLQSRFKRLGFKPTSERGSWRAEFVKNANESITVDCFGTVYLHYGFTKRGTALDPICIKSFTADTPAKIEVLVEPLLDPNYTLLHQS